MASSDDLIKLINAHLSGRNEQFTATIRELAASERRAGNNDAAEALEKALSSNRGKSSKELTRLNGTSVYHGTRSIPLSKGDQFPLVEVKQPNATPDDIILSPSIKSRLDKISWEQFNKSKLAKFGLRPISRILFYGPPGCGKTLAAEVTAFVLECPLLYVRFDSVISSYLGETSSNLRRVFDFANNGLSVLFFDEFDAIGKSRDSEEELGELKRVVNSFLQMMDNYQGNSIVIAATNHERLLDNALWRRFDEVVYFGLPNLTEIFALLKLRLGGIRMHDFTIEDVAELFNGLSYSDISKICVDAIKQMIYENQLYISEKMIRSSLNNFVENRPLARFPKSDNE